MKEKLKTIIEDLEIDTTIHEELIQEVADVYKRYCEKLQGGSIDGENLPRVAGYLTIAYMVRRLSVKDLPLNKEKRMKILEEDKDVKS